MNTKCYYWLGTPNTTGSSSYIGYLKNITSDGYFNSYYYDTVGVRPVVSILGVEFTQTETAGLWTISQNTN